jgi:RIO kinase 2
VVPTSLIQQLSGTRGGSGVHRNISTLAKDGLIAKVKNARYDGYRLTYGGLDYLALNTHRRANTIFSLGNQIGVGKESDIYVCASPSSRQLVLKLHRLGRISFRTVKANRDYLRNRNSGSWMYLSRLAAQKEHAFMQVLHREGFPVPEPVAWSRHTVVMEFIDAFPLRMIDSVPEPGKLYAELMEMIVKLAQRGLIHGDFNEFNILIKESGRDDSKHDSARADDEDGQRDANVTLTPILIDFPQTLSTNHTNAEFYFDRDVNCVKRYFERRLRYVSDEPGPFFKDATKGIVMEKRLDVEVEATGFSRKMAKELEKYVEIVGGDAEDAEQISKAEGEGSDVDDEDDEDDEEFVGADATDEFHGGNEERLNDTDSQAPQLDSHTLPEELASLSVQDDLSVKQPDSMTAANLASLEMSYGADVVARKVKTKKKAAGWAI